MATQFTQVSWAQDLLSRLGFPTTPTNVASIVAWEYAEGGHFLNSASYNPLNTTLPSAGSRPMNSVGVQAYPDYESGMKATIQTLLSGANTHGYSRILSVLQTQGGPSQLASAVGSTPWGTSTAGILGTSQRAISTVGGRVSNLPSAAGSTPSSGLTGTSDIGNVQLAGFKVPNPLDFLDPFKELQDAIELAFGAGGSAVGKGIFSLLFSGPVAKLFVRGLEIVGGALLMGGGIVVLIKVLGDETGATKTVKTGAAIATGQPELIPAAQKTSRSVANRQAGRKIDRAERQSRPGTSSDYKLQRRRYRERSTIENRDTTTRRRSRVVLAEEPF